MNRHLKVDNYACVSLSLLPAVVDVEIGGHDGPRQQRGMSPRDSINHGGYRPPVDMSGSTHQVYQLFLRLVCGGPLFGVQ